MSCTRSVPGGGRFLAAVCNGLLIWAMAAFLGAAVLADDAAKIKAHLDAGEFGPARAAAGAIGNPAVRDRILGDIAAAQAGAGARRASLDTAYDISSDV